MYESLKTNSGRVVKLRLLFPCSGYENGKRCEVKKEGKDSGKEIEREKKSERRDE